MANSHFWKTTRHRPPKTKGSKNVIVWDENTSNIIIKTNSQIININEFRAEEQSIRSHFAYNKAIWFSYHKLKYISPSRRNPRNIGYVPAVNLPSYQHLPQIQRSRDRGIHRAAEVGRFPRGSGPVFAHAHAFGFEFELAGADRFMAPNKMPRDNQPNHQAQPQPRFASVICFLFSRWFSAGKTGVCVCVCLCGGGSGNGAFWLPDQLLNQIVNARRVQ